MAPKSDVYQKMLAQIQIYEEDIILIVDGTTKVVDMNTILRIFADEAEVSLDMPLHPKFRFVAQRGRRFFFVAEPEVDFPVIYENDCNFIIDMPALLFCVTQDRAGYCETLEIYAYDGNLKPETELKYPPVTNVRAGKMCMGSVRVKETSMCDFIEKAFYFSKFSPDYATLPANNGEPIFDLYKKTQGKDLLPHLKTITTYKELLSA